MCAPNFCARCSLSGPPPIATVRRRIFRANCTPRWPSPPTPLIAEARALAMIPDALKSEDAAPLVCAGITTFNALRNAARAGDTVAIQGVGGLGHLGVQFARKMGLRTVAIGGGPDKEHLAQKFGAHIYIDAKAQDAAAALQKLDRKSTRLNSSHTVISYAVFCLKKKKNKYTAFSH